MEATSKAAAGPSTNRELIRTMAYMPQKPPATDTRRSVWLTGLGSMPSHLGQLYENETFQRLHHGERLKGYIKQVRKDGKIDLMLQLPSHLERDRLSDAIVAHLRQNEGVTALTDKSPPDDIYQVFGVSKASYKKALGQLYKQRVISIDKNQIRLLDESIEELATRDR